ncbi:Plastid transcriptionally active 9 [Dorcoceras hygrometricum]|uniref:Plastid transcriptionally active 9 n=1 Tax=Dorcoceras hygrometricum TaxID=472368 RepID=A0A2Z7DE69_9LAMI|nr:Plastid transcriptionally active 9 [Dorcoceras hygrometricum]
MNLHSGAKLSAHGFTPLRPPRKPLAFFRILGSLQRFNIFSIKATSNIQKTDQFSKSDAQKSSETSPSLYHGIERHSAVLTDWPRPREIPFRVKFGEFDPSCPEPCKFEDSSNKKPFAATVISRAAGGEKNSLFIPVVFEGDLAHIVARHVQVNEFAFVSGKLTRDHPMQLLLNQYLGGFMFWLKILTL